jgi:molybdenum cofactor cytidylyltransferase
MPDVASRAFKLGAVVLAAGGSSRMGATKQLLNIGGSSLVARASDAALRSGADPVVVVVGADAARVRAEVASLPVLSVTNSQWATGLASSIRVGIEALLEAEPELDAVLVAPCDQPALSAEVIARLTDLHRSTGRIAASRYDGRNGAPAVFGRENFEDLAGLAGDAGARKLLNSDSGNVASVDLPELASDVDTPADYAGWLASRD